MRRKDRECNSQEFLKAVMEACEVVFVSFQEDPCPYCLPFNFVHENGRIFIHCAKEGRKLDLLANNPHVGFAMCHDVAIDRAKATTYYKSVSGAGRAFVVMDADLKCRALDLLAIKYNALCARPATWATAARVGIICIDIEKMTGKASVPA